MAERVELIRLMTYYFNLCGCVVKLDRHLVPEVKFPLHFIRFQRNTFRSLIFVAIRQNFHQIQKLQSRAEANRHLDRKIKV